MAVLFLMVGFPGAGKTTTSRLIAKLTGAVHIWADNERRKMFGDPTHSLPESKALYAHLNNLAAELLGQGKSVIFDTNFNFRRDRDHLRAIACAAGADTRIIWIQVDKSLALDRAQHEDHATDNHYTETMQRSDFDRMTSHLQAPTADEQPIILDGTCITASYLSEKLGLS